MAFPSPCNTSPQGCIIIETSSAAGRQMQTPRLPENFLFKPFPATG